MLKKILNFFVIINNYLNREDAYQEYLKQTNLKCFNENFACCKKSLT